MKEEQLKATFLIKKIDEAMARHANKRLQHCDLTHVQAHLLMALHHAEPEGLSLKELEKYFQVSQPTMVGNVSRLEKKDLISTFPDPRDRRSKRVCLSARGLEHCRSAHDNMAQLDDFLTSGLSEAERAEFLRLLLLVYKAVRQEENEPN